MKRILISMLAVLAWTSSLAPLPAAAQAVLVVKPLAEKKVAELPAGPLYWRIENFGSLPEAQAAASATALAVESAGNVWLFTLGAAGGVTVGTSKVAEVGPLPPVVATHYLLRINEASGPLGSVTPVHTHPGSESFYVVRGETSSRSPHDVTRVGMGQVATGHGANMPMQVSSTGSTDLLSLVMFVVDADKPFSTPATMQ